MSRNITRGDAADLVQEDHLALRQRIQHLQQIIHAPDASPAVLWRELRSLELELLEHFRHEENEGFFDSLLDAAPEFAEPIAALQRQHQELRVVITALKDECRVPELDRRQLAKLGQMFASFVVSFDGHEHAEVHLVQETANRDQGAAD